MATRKSAPKKKSGARAAVAVAAPANGSFPHLAVECVTPEVDGGRYPVKRVVGDAVHVEADIIKEGHDRMAARVRFRGPGDDDWRYAPLVFDFELDRWSGDFTVDTVGTWTFTVEAWTDRFRTWRGELEKKVGAGQEVNSELLEGAELVNRALGRMRFGQARTALQRAVMILRDQHTDVDERVEVALDRELLGHMEEHWIPDDLTTFRRELTVRVDRERGRFASWYEFFPRSTSLEPGRHGTFRDSEWMLERIAELGFDVVYLPPIHPVGVSARKGPNNTLVAGPDDPGSPWAIGNEHGGHDAVDPNLGTIDDFDWFVRRANELGLEIALDYALQCSPDHPWLKEHPEWFFVRPDGTIKYAENPPKKYQDIYPINFWSEDREGLWNACRDVLLHWIDHGVRTFRVDNPHTKPFAFWEWVIAEVHQRHPDVIFFSEAFTRPKRLKLLAKLGFQQSYTYFTWKNTPLELSEWWAEMHTPEALEYLRGNLFVNTPDILTEYLQTGGRAAFRARLVLAATMSPLYGVYSGFELLEGEAVKKGSEEYLHSEKYQVRQRDYDAPGNLNAEMRLLNGIRREHRALQLHDNLTFHQSDNASIVFYRKAGGAGHPDILVCVNTDPHRAHDTIVHVPLAEMGLTELDTYIAHDLLTGARFTWRGSRNYVRLDPRDQVGHVLRIER